MITVTNLQGTIALANFIKRSRLSEKAIAKFAVAITVNNEAQYSGGGGRGLKLAVKVPNALTSKVVDVSVAPKSFLRESQGESENAVVFKVIVEL